MYYIRFYGNGWEDVYSPATGLIQTFDSVEDAKDYASHLSDDYVYSIWFDDKMVQSQNFNGKWLKTVDISGE